MSCDEPLPEFLDHFLENSGGSSSAPSGRLESQAPSHIVRVPSDQDTTAHVEFLDVDISHNHNSNPSNPEPKASAEKPERKSQLVDTDVPVDWVGPE